MGQYHYVVNLDKREYLHPHDLGDGLKLMEFGCSANGTLMGLALLLAGSNGPEGRGGGDWHPWTGEQGRYGDGRTVGVVEDTLVQQLTSAIPGRWCGDRIAIVGDYHEPGDIQNYSGDTPWEDPDENVPTSDVPWLNISAAVMAAMRLDFYTNEDMRKYEEQHDYAAQKAQKVAEQVPATLDAMKRTEYAANG